MKAMKSMKVNRMLGSLKRKPRDTDSQDADMHAGPDTPEANAVKNVRQFCESGGPNGSGEEVLFLPAIVEACESSPGAAKEAAYIIRKYLGKDNLARPYVQYNSIMLIRILSDNPGKTFTRNMDTKFVLAVKELLRVGRDPSVKQILMETLDTFLRDKQEDEGCAMLLEMWKKEKERMQKVHPTCNQGTPGARSAPGSYPQGDSSNYFARNHHTRRLPPPAELSSRIEEARTSAQLLSQTVQSTPPSELLVNDLVREFADRCQSASRSVQAYMIAENPAPDNDTMLTLIETNEQLTKAMNQHQRGLLSARKAMGLGSASSTPPARTDSGFAPPPGPPPSQIHAPKPTRNIPPQIPPPGDYAPTGLSDSDREDNPFADPKESRAPRPSQSPPFPKDQPNNLTGQFNDRLGIEPYHPGYKETPSYVGRQESSMGKTSMHAAGSPVEEEPESSRSRRPDGEAAYGVQPQTKAPVYRY
ncbi:hypothetical protein BJ875DRAFT_537105 [Amylocarpus encephaloides]|uniref:GAT domain-containing protein n=1 Tax=Amylocarpus encephaloides TaxID=45428 RepID=A0A9P8C1I6_9HELO|nr:hypothetical protein BJ875DRAFT_537105 [Amylocarpus encephaloides]